MAVNGTITFEIDGDNVGSVTPVIYLNGGAGKTAAQGGPSIRLETSATSAGEFAAATEAFGLAGQVTYVGQLGAEGDFAGTVASVNKDTNTFSTDATAATPGDPGATPPVPAQPAAASARYTYDDNDEFQLGGQTVDLATFESQLSSGDGISGTFAQNASGNSTFNLTDTNPGPITGVTAERSGAATGTVTVEGTFPGDLREIDSFVVQRASVADSNDDDMDELGDYTTVATVPASDTDATAAGVQLRYVDNNVPTGEYQYRLAAINDGDQGPFTASATTAGSSAQQTTVVDTRLTDGGNDTDPFVLGAGDSFTIVTSQDLEDLDGNEQLRISDTDGTVGDFVNGGNATFTLNTAEETVGGTAYPAGRVITVAINANSVNQANQQNGVDTLGFPATITDSAGITDESGTKIALTGDVTIENDAPEANPNPAPNPNPNPGPNTPAAFTPAQGANAQTVTFTSDEDLDPNSVDAGDFEANQQDGTTVNVDSATLGADNRTITVNLGQALTTGGTVVLQGGSVQDADGNNEPTADVTYTQA